MRNNDGVYSRIGSLDRYIGLDTPVEEAARQMSGQYHIARRAPFQEEISKLNRILRRAGYSGYEYMGYFCFYYENRGEDRSRKTTDTGRERLRWVAGWLSKESLEGFLRFKKTRLRLLEIKMNTVKEYIRGYINLGMGIEDIIRRKQVQMGPWQLAEVICIYHHDIDPEFSQAIFNSFSYAIGEHYRMSPELVVVCPLLTARIQENEGDNEYARLFFSSTVR